MTSRQVNVSLFVGAIIFMILAFTFGAYIPMTVGTQTIQVWAANSWLSAVGAVFFVIGLVRTVK